jgi:hypothetical protein
MIILEPVEAVLMAEHASRPNPTWTTRPSPLDPPYGKYQPFLVRTALVRPDDWDPRKDPSIDNHDAARRHFDELSLGGDGFGILGVDARNNLLAVYYRPGPFEDVELARAGARFALLTSSRAVLVAVRHDPGFTDMDYASSRHLQAMVITVIRAMQCIGIDLFEVLSFGEPTSYSGSRIPNRGRSLHYQGVLEVLKQRAKELTPCP